MADDEQATTEAQEPTERKVSVDILYSNLCTAGVHLHVRTDRWSVGFNMIRSREWYSGTTCPCSLINSTVSQGAKEATQGLRLVIL